MKNYDVIIIGGGAAGMCCAVSLKEIKPDCSVAVLEQLSRVGKKLIATGNGRCNITNRNIDISRYHSENPEFCRFALEKFSGLATENFFEKLGVVFTYDETGRAYPYSLQASSVVDALRYAAFDRGIDTYTEAEVVAVEKKNGGYTIKTDGDVFFARTVVMAAGMLSGGKKTGSTGSVFSMLKKAGYKTVEPSPAIVQLRTETAATRQLKGIKVNALAGLYNFGRPVRAEYGEVLFCDYGLSGPPILQISRETGRRSGKYTVVLDLAVEYSNEEFYRMLLKRRETLGTHKAEEFFTGLLNKRVGQVIVKLCRIALNTEVSAMTDKDLKLLANTVKSFEFAVTGNCGFENSQVTAGGLSTDGFEAKTMMSKKDAGLFAVGEILDVDGDCGGFNLQWAWSSAMCAAENIIGFLGENK